VADASPERPRRALLKAGDVCEIAKVQPYVLRSWEKEFPDLGVTRTDGGPRFYRQADVDHVLRIKQLVFGEGLTLAGARRRLEEQRTAEPDELPFDDEPAVAAAPADLRERIDGVRQGLRELLSLLSSAPRPAVHTRASASFTAAADDAPMAAAGGVKKAARKRRAAAE
jgi:DNA-binding transcriptional MerR regulator